MCLSLGHQNPSKTSEKMGYFDRVTVSLQILYTENQETIGFFDLALRALVASVGLALGNISWSQIVSFSNNLSPTLMCNIKVK